jgi:hypothetical protein
MSKERLQTILRFWQEKERWWAFKILHAVWVDDGKGGCVDKNLEYIKAKAKAEILEQLISEYK